MEGRLKDRGGAGFADAGERDGGSAASARFDAELDARLGAIIAFSTFVEPQTGQFTSERLTCLS
jgi:hypothetical protein